MALTKPLAIAFAGLCYSGLVAGQFSSCPQPTTNDVALEIQPGYELTKLVDGLANPRQIVTDTGGKNLIVASLGDGLIGLDIAYDRAGCPSVASKKTIVPDDGRNFTHAVVVAPCGTTLFASTPEFAYAWDYDAKKRAVTGPARTIVNGMFIPPPTLSLTRSLGVSRAYPNTLLVFRGSVNDTDERAADPAQGYSVLKAFDWRRAPPGGYDFVKDGELVASGIRDALEFTEDGAGRTWAVDNGADGFTRGGQAAGADPGEPNPADELYSFGPLRLGASPEEAPDFGFPYCHTVWNGTALPDNPQGLSLGQAFTTKPEVISDAQCNQDTRKPRLSIPPHAAPLGLRFYAPATPALGPHLVGSAFVTYHGPKGKKVVLAPFRDGEPTAPADSPDAFTDFVWTDRSFNLSTCKSHFNEDGAPCFSPVGLEVDRQGTLFVTSDLTGEVFAVTKKRNYK